MFRRYVYTSSSQLSGTSPLDTGAGVAEPDAGADARGVTTVDLDVDVEGLNGTSLDVVAAGAAGGAGLITLPGCATTLLHPLPAAAEGADAGVKDCDGFEPHAAAVGVRCAGV